MAQQRALFDTSVLIAQESGRPVDPRLAEYTLALSVITLGELYAGIHAASDSDVRSDRLATLQQVADVEVLVVNEAVAAEWGAMRAHLVDGGRRVNVNDLWIAATAVANELPLLTQDGDFDPLDGIRGLTVVQV